MNHKCLLAMLVGIRTVGFSRWLFRGGGGKLANSLITPENSETLNKVDIL